MSKALTAHADALREAESRRAPLAPLSAADATLDIAAAYRIQRLNVEARVGEGAVVRGHKVGLTSRPMQELLGVTEPDFGTLLDTMFIEEGDPVPLDELIQPKVEAEIAWVLDRDLGGPGVTTAMAARAVAGALPALEVIDSRVADWEIHLVDTVADNASSGRVVLGGRITPLDGLDSRLLGMVVSRGGKVVATAAGAAVLGNPLRCVAWLANALGAMGVSLAAGDVVLSGALHAAFEVGEGDVVRADIGRLGSVSARFANRDGAES